MYLKTNGDFYDITHHIDAIAFIAIFYGADQSDSSFYAKTQFTIETQRSKVRIRIAYLFDDLSIRNVLKVVRDAYPILGLLPLQSDREKRFKKDNEVQTPF